MTKSGEDALTQAARKGHTQLVELLISHGAAIVSLLVTVVYDGLLFLK